VGLEHLKSAVGGIGLTIETQHHHVGFAGVGRDAGHFLQSFEQGFTLGANDGGLLGEHLSVLQRKQSAFGVEHAHVVRRAQFVDLVDQCLRGDHVAQANACQTELRQRAHQQHISVRCGMLANFIEPAFAGERLIRLVHHHQATVGADLLDEAANGVGVPQIGGGVVGVRDVDNSGLVLRDGGRHGDFVQLKVGLQRHADVLQTLELRAHAVHHKAGLWGQHFGIWYGTCHRQQRDEFVRAVAQHQA